MRRYPSSMRFARGKRNESREAFVGAQSRWTPISASPYIRRRAKSAPSGAASVTLSALKPIPRLFLHQGGDGVEQTDGSRETRMGLPLSFIGRLEPAPPIDEEADQGARRNLSKSDARKTLQPE